METISRSPTSSAITVTADSFARAPSHVYGRCRATFTNSQIDMRLQPAHTAEVTYAESRAIDTDLTGLRSTPDGIMDEVHQIRERYQADLGP